MKKTFIPGLLLFLLTFCFLPVQAQPDSGLNFQAVARDGTGNLITNGSIAVRFFIQRTSPSVSTVYSETHTGVSTDAFGLFNIVIGTGTPISGSFANIDWSASPYQVEVRLDDSGSGTYQLVGIMPLQKSPKAFFADVADSVKTVHLNALDDVNIAPGSLQSGDVLQWDGSNWVRESSVESHTIFIGPMNFHPSSDIYDFARSSGGTYLNTATTAPMYAPFQLPVGSVITDARVHYYDNSSVNLLVRIMRVFQTSSGLSIVASYTTSGTSTLFRNDPMSISLPQIIDNYFYHIQVNPSGGVWTSSSLRIRGVEITYTLP
ncbi:MAG: hypothetical protein AAF206_29860 [Bacteroidota bacterium]